MTRHLLARRRQAASFAALGVLSIAVAGAAGCSSVSHSPVGATRFHNRAPIWLVNDRRHVDTKPEDTRYDPVLWHYEGHFAARLDRWMAMRPARRAANVNSLDEVPDSSWFTNRIGVRDLTVADIAMGPNTGGSPVEHMPLVVKRSKPHLIDPRFIVEDQRGIAYLLKFDALGAPETESGADVVAQRLLWAIGYNVPQDYVVDIRRSDLVVPPDAVIEPYRGKTRKMTASFVDSELGRTDRQGDGSYRVLMSRYVPGEPIGGHSGEGVREDDPNDLVPHELHRELRGLYPIFAWLSLTDVHKNNFVDTYVTDPEVSPRRYVVHYLVDFDSALGSQAVERGHYQLGHQYTFDAKDLSLSLITFGLYQRPFEGRQQYFPQQIRGVGMFESESFDPGTWKASTPSYVPLLERDRLDAFWGAKIIVRFTPAHIRAAVDAGRYSDPRAADYLTRVLIERQRKTARYWFRQVNPLDRFSVEEDQLSVRVCFDDLAVLYRLEPGTVERTSYRISIYDGAGRPTGWSGGVAAHRSGRVCVPGVRPAAAVDGYTILRIETNRPGLDLPATLVHLARHPRTGRLRLVGLRRL